VSNTAALNQAEGRVAPLSEACGPARGSPLPQIAEVFEYLNCPSPRSNTELFVRFNEFAIISSGNLCEFPIFDDADARVTTAERITGEKNVELNRLAVSIRCLHWLLDGSTGSYSAFTSCQYPKDHNASDPRPEHVLSEEKFASLSSYVQGVLNTDSKRQAVLVALVLNTAAKVGPEAWDKMRAFLPEAHSEFIQEALDAVWQGWKQDTDDHQQALLTLLKATPELCPSFLALEPEAQQMIIRALESGLNLGQFLQLENTEASFSGYLELPEETREFLNVFFLSLVGGAAGHVAENGSLVINEKYAERFEVMRDALQNSSEEAIYAPMLEICAEQLGADLDHEDGRALTRLGTMMGFTSPDQYQQLREVFYSRLLSPEVRDVLRNELNDTGLNGHEATVIYYGPALLSNCYKASSSSPEGILTGLQSFSVLLNEARQNCTDNTTSGINLVYVRDYARLATDRERFFKAKPSLQPLGKSFRVIPEFPPLKQPGSSLDTILQRRIPTQELFLDHDPMQELYHDIVDMRTAISCREAQCQAKESIANETFETASKLFHLMSQLAQFIPGDVTDEIQQTVVWDGSAEEVSQAQERLDATVQRMLDAVEDGFTSEEHLKIHRAVAECRSRLKHLSEMSALSVPLYQVRIARQGELWVTTLPLESGGIAQFEIRRPEDALIQRPLSRLFSSYGRVAEVQGHQVSEAQPHEVNRISSMLSTLFPDVDVAVDVDQERHLLCLTQSPKWIGIADQNLLPQVHFELQKSLDDIDEKIGLLSDQYTLANPFGTEGARGTLISLMHARRALQKACITELVSTIQGDANDDLRRSFGTVRAILDENPTSLKSALTRFVKPATPEENYAASIELARLGEQTERRPGDPRIAQHGGDTSKIQRFIHNKLNQGAWILTCSGKDNTLGGFYLVVPPEALANAYPEVQKRYALYGSQAYMAHVAVGEDAAGLPAYNLLTNRVRLLTANAEVAVGRVLLENLKGFRAHLSAGKANLFVGDEYRSETDLPYPGYNSLKELYVGDARARFIRGEEIAPEDEGLRHSDYIGVVAPLGERWWGMFHELTLLPGQARNQACQILNHNLPGIYNRDIDDVFELWTAVENRELSLWETIQDGFASLHIPPKRAQNEMLNKTYHWQDDVVDYFASVHPTKNEEELFPIFHFADKEELHALKEELRPHADIHQLRKLLSYF
jgi:hypothetical protein